MIQRLLIGCRERWRQFKIWINLSQSRKRMLRNLKMNLNVWRQVINSMNTQLLCSLDKYPQGVMHSFKLAFCKKILIRTNLGSIQYCTRLQSLLTKTKMINQFGLINLWIKFWTNLFLTVRWRNLKNFFVLRYLGMTVFQLK